MKKIYSYLFAAVAIILAAVACNKEIQNNEPLQPVGETITFLANTEVPTKTVLEGNPTDGFQTKWKGREFISIIGSGENQNYWFETDSLTTPTATATFTYKGEAPYAATGGVLAVYPSSNSYGKEFTADAVTVKKVSIPTSVDGILDPFESCHVPMVAYSTTNTLEFKNAAAILKFTVGNTSVRGVTFAGKGEVITGNFDISVDLTVEGNPLTFTPSEGNTGGTYKEVKAMDPEGTGRLAKGIDYYMPIAPTNFTNGYLAELQFVENGPKFKVKERESAKELLRNGIYDLGELTLIVPEGAIYFKPSNDWKADGAVFAVWAWGGTDAGGGKWYNFVDSSADRVLQTAIPTDADGFKFARLNPTPLDPEKPNPHWDNRWNETGNFICSEIQGNCFVLDEGVWDGTTAGTWSKVE